MLQLHYYNTIEELRDRSEASLAAWLRLNSGTEDAVKVILYKDTSVATRSGDDTPSYVLYIAYSGVRRVFLILFSLLFSFGLVRSLW